MTRPNVNVAQFRQVLWRGDPSWMDQAACGSLEEYAGLNRWLGVHVESNCLAVEDCDRLAARVNELSALAASQADEIRSLTLELARERKKRVGW